MNGASLLLVLSVALGAQTPAPQRAAPARATLGQLTWLAGEWSGSMGRSSIEERWTPAGGGAMFAVSRTIAGERLVAFEFLRIVERDGGLVYIAQPNGRPPTEFVLTAIDANAATFENPAHDFPKMIRYTRREDGGLEARVSGSNGERAQSFVFKRLPCDPALKLAMRASRASEPPKRSGAGAPASGGARGFRGMKSPGLV